MTTPDPIRLDYRPPTRGRRGVWFYVGVILLIPVAFAAILFSYFILFKLTGISITD